MPFSRYSKLTQEAPAPQAKRLGLDPDPSAGTRFFLHTVSAISSLLLLLFIFTVNQIGPDQLASLTEIVQKIPFLDIKFSTTLIEDLKFAKPITIFIVSVMAIYASYAVIDLQRKKKPETVKQIDKSYFSESGDISYAIHILLLLLILVSSFLNYHPKPKIKITEIEFVPTQIESRKAPPVTKRRAVKQSVSSGKHDPEKPITPVTQAAGKPKVSPSPKPEVKAEPVKQTETKTNTAQPIPPKPQPRMAKPQPSPAPAPKQSAPTPKQTSFAPNTFAPPSPKPQVSPQALPREAMQQARINPSASSLPVPKTYSSAGGIGSSSSGSGTNPSPKFDSSGAGETSNLVARIASIPKAPSMGNGGAYGGPSNPDANDNPNGPASLGARADVNFGPYMSALQRKIKMAWKPPRGTESNHIVVMFVINKTGYLQDIRLTTPSKSQEANAAALDAVKRAAPFDPPPAGAPPTLEIEFTFDYSVFNNKERW